MRPSAYQLDCILREAVGIKHYAGIGSRSTPEDVQLLMTGVAVALRKNKWILRSGGARGADQAFEAGADDLKEVYLPWEGYEDSESELYPPHEDCYDYVKVFHPAPYNLKFAVETLLARNTHQLLGRDLDSPSCLVICWTPGGKDVGGTAQALRVARAYDIPISNLADPEQRDFWERFCAKQGTKK